MSQSSPTSFCGSSLSIQPLVCAPLLDSGTLPSKPILPVGAAECDGSQRPNCAPSVSPRYRSPRRRRASRRSIPTCNKTNSPRPTPLNRETKTAYFTSLCAVCFRHVLQNFCVSSRSLCFFLFLVVV